MVEDNKSHVNIILRFYFSFFFLHLVSTTCNKTIYDFGIYMHFNRANYDYLTNILKLAAFFYIHIIIQSDFSVKI